MKNPRMLYRYPGPYPIHDGMYDYIIVEETSTPGMLQEGWYLTTHEARAANEQQNPVKLKKKG